MQRREFAKTVGGIVGTAAVGTGGLLAVSGSAAAGESGFEGSDTVAVTTDDGQIQFVAFGGYLKYEWDGLDTPAQYGEYQVEARLRGDHFDDGATGWRNFGSRSGVLDTTSWGGDNDPDSGSGTEGWFEFRFGSEYGQRDYAVAYNEDVGANPKDYNVIPVENPFEIRHFESDEDGSVKATTLELRFTCRVYDGDPENGGSMVGVEDSAVGTMPVEVENRQATGTTGGRIDGTVGADES